MNFIKTSKTEFVLCQGVGLLGAAAVLLAGGLTWLTGALALLPVIAGALVGQRLVAARCVMQQSIDAYLAGQAQFGEQLVPVWKNHIEASRSQMEAAVNALSDRFGGIVDKLDVALRNATQATDSVRARAPTWW